MNLRLDWCSYEAAKYAVMNWHYSARIPKFKQVYIGVWENEKFIGVVIFGLSVTPYLGSKYMLKNTECVELTRIALTKHRAPVSQIVAIALKLIRNQSPGLRLIISYADPNQGHNGSIYQAGNWIYVGTSSKVRQYFWRGSWRNDTSMFREFRLNPDLRKMHQYRDLPPKYKYLYPLDKEMREQIDPLAKPYPKKNCDSGVNRSTPSFQDGGSGAVPTESLHLNYA